MRTLVLFLSLGLLHGCDCSPCGDMHLEIVDAQTGEPVANAEAVVALHAHARRHPVEDTLIVGEYRLWVRAPGYRLLTERVEIPGGCIEFETDECSAGGTYTVALERR